MKWTIILALGLAVAAALLWRVESSRPHSGASDFSTEQIAGQSQSGRAEASRNKTPPRAVASAPSSQQQARLTVIETFNQKRRIGPGRGGETAAGAGSPLQPYKEKNLQLTDLRTFNSRPYQVLGARAVPLDRYASSMGEIFFEQNGFAVIGLASRSAEAWQDLVFYHADRPVVVNPSNGRLGIVTGTLAVKMTKMDLAGGLAARERLTILTTDDSIRMVYMRPAEGVALLQVQQKLAKSPEVEQVDIEVYDIRKEAK